MQNRIILILSIIIIILPIFGFLTLPGFQGMRTELFGTNQTSYERTTSRIFSTSAYHLVYAPVVPEEAPEVTTKDERDEIINAVYVTDKEPAQYIRVDAVTLSAPGFVVLFEKGAIPTGEIASASRYLEAGEHTGIIINLGHEPLAGDMYDAVLVLDDGDEEFDIVSDGLVRDASGNAIFDDFEFISVGIETE